MEDVLKIKVDSNGETAENLLKFITETQEGKYTVEKPNLNQITYKRLQIQEQDKFHSVDNVNGEIVLFGISY